MALGLGSNLGDRLGHLRAGVRGVREFVRILAVSPVYESIPVGYADQPDFLNAALTGTTDLGPHELLSAAHRIEAATGRTRSFRDAPRVLDLDVILYGGLVVRGPHLSVPHPRWKERSFVLAPLADVAPEMVDPETERTVQEIWDSRRAGLPPLERVASPDVLWRQTR